MVRELLALILFTAGCSSYPQIHYYACDPFVIDVKRESGVICPSARETGPRVQLVLEAADAAPEDIEPWQAVFAEAIAFDTDNDGIACAGGYTAIDGRKQVFVGNTQWREYVLSHELFHAALYETTGDYDYGHKHSNWSMVN